MSDFLPTFSTKIQANSVYFPLKLIWGNLEQSFQSQPIRESLTYPT